MSNPIYNFKIKIEVKHRGRTYKIERDEKDQDCHHIDNLPCVADYMARELEKRIHNRKPVCQ